MRGVTVQLEPALHPDLGYMTAAIHPRRHWVAPVFARRWAHAVVAFAVIALGVAGPAHAETPLGVTLNPDRGGVGDVVRFSGSGCPHVDKTGTHLADGTFRVFLGLNTSEGASLMVRFFSDGSDNFSGETDPIPANTPVGPHQTTVACDTNEAGAVAGPVYLVVPQGSTTPSTTTTIATPSTPSPALVYRFAPPAGPVGTTVDVFGVGCPPGQHAGADNSVDGRLYLWKGTDTAEGPFMVIQAFDAQDSSGRFEFTFTIPDSTGIAPGTHLSRIRCTGGEVDGPTFTVTASLPTTVTTSTAITPPPTLNTVIEQAQAAVDQQAPTPATAAMLTLVITLLQQLFGG